MTEGFPAFLSRLVRERYGGIAARLAADIGISDSQVSRAMKGKRATQFGVLSCLRLADRTGESPSLLLRLTGKPEEAALIEKLYGPPRPMASTDRRLLDMPDAMKAHLLALVTGTEPRASDASGVRRRKRTGSG
jgi:hypothetical protein